MKIEDRYMVIQELGSGSAGTVYKVRDLLEDRILALKLFTGDPEERENVETLGNEFKLLSGLDHPNLVKVRDFAVDSKGMPFFTMDFVDGSNILEYIRSSGFPEPHGDWDAGIALLYKLSFQIGEALAVIHSRALVHGDLKPPNILVSGRGGPEPVPAARLLDFGLSRMITAPPSRMLSGTLEYMAPEFFFGEPLHKGSDMYALGVILYELLTGKYPVSGKNPAEILQAHASGSYPAPGTLEPRIDSRLESLILRLLSPNPLDRCADGFEFLMALSDLSGIGCRTIKGAHVRNLVPGGRFAGRKKEKNRLKQLFEAASKGSNCFALISGETGTGKSRLASDLKARAQLSGARVITATSSGTGFMKDVTAVVEQAVMILGRDHPSVQKHVREISAVAPWLADSASSDSASIDPSEKRPGGQRRMTPQPVKESHRILRAVSDLLFKAADEVTTFVVYEDIHLAGSLASELIIHLGRLILSAGPADATAETADPPSLACDTGEETRKGGGLFILATCDTDRGESATIKDEIIAELGEKQRFLRLDLEPLSEDETGEYLLGLLRGNPAEIERVTRHIHETTGGNPLFLQEYVKLLVEEEKFLFSGNGFRAKADLLFDRVTPVSLGEALSHRLAGLSFEETEVLRVLSVCGFSGSLDIPLSLLQAPAYELNKALKNLEAARLIQMSKDGYEFASGFIMDTVYASIPDSGRKRLHLAAGSRIEDLSGAVPGIHSELLAYHFSRTGEPKRGMKYLEEAGRKLERAGALLEAEGYFARAVDFLDLDDTIPAGEKLRKKFDLQHARTVILDQAGRRREQEESVRVLAEIARELDDPECEIARLMEEIIYFGRIPKLEKALEITLKGIAFAERHGLQRQELRIKLMRASLLHKRLDFKNHLALIREVLPIARELGFKDEEANARLQLGFSQVPGEAVDHEANIAEFNRAAEIFAELNAESSLVTVYMNLGNSCFSLKKYEQAIKTYGRGIELAEKLGYDRGVAWMLQNTGCIYFELGLPDEAQDCLERSLRIFRLEGDVLDAGIAHGSLGKNQLLKGSYERARMHFEKAVEINAGLKRVYSEIDNLVWLASTLQQAGDTENSLALLEKIDERLDEAGDEDGLHRILPRIYRSLNLLELGKVSESYRFSREAVTILERNQNRVFMPEAVWYLHSRIASRYESEIEWNRPGATSADIRERESTKFLERAYERAAHVASLMSDPVLKRAYCEKSLYPSNIFKEYRILNRETEPEKFLGMPSLKALYDISSNINSTLDPEILLTRILTLAVDTLRAERGLLALVNDSGELEVRTAVGLADDSLEDAREVSLSTLKDVSGTSRPILVTGAFDDERFRNRRSIVNLRISSILAVPLASRGKPAGVVYLDRRAVENPFTPEDLAFLEAFSNLAAVALDNARMHEELKRENISLKTEVRDKFRFERLIGVSASMQAVYRAMEAAMRSDAAVLVDGKSGTGKELVASAIHHNGLRREGKFLPVDCGAIPESLLESELFGHARGAFTGAATSKRGLFEDASGGTLFLDEIGNTSPSFQARLLRVLQEGEVRRLGESLIRKVDVRVIAATNVDLEERLRDGTFREDLYYRLNVFNIQLPDLRERLEDIPLLAEFFLEKAGKRLKEPVRTLSREAVEVLSLYPWPGNIRELENEMERITAFGTDRRMIESADLHPRILEGAGKPVPAAPSGGKSGEPGPPGQSRGAATGAHLPEWLLDEETRPFDELEEWYITWVYEKLGQNKVRTAEVLGLSRSTLQRRFKEIEGRSA